MDEREILSRLIQGPVSGDALAREQGQTRASIWKRMEALRQAGVPIAAVPGRGYELEQPFDLLDHEAIIDSLQPHTRARLASLEIAWTLDSTNSELLRRPVPADRTGLSTVLLAERQTGGRGRQGREWCSPLAAHLYLSLSRSFDGGLARLGGLSLVVGIATAEALHALGYPMVRLKWPNDLVVAGADGLRKLGGLLVEGGGEHGGPARAVIGLGLNVRMPQAYGDRIDQPWCDLASLGGVAAVPRNAIAAGLLAHWLPALDEFDTHGLQHFLPRYAEVDALAGRRVDIHPAPGTGSDPVATGEALGVASDGALRVRMEDGTERSFHSGEASIRRHGGPA